MGMTVALHKADHNGRDAREIIVSSNVMVDLTDVDWPESLLQCKCKLDAMASGTEMDILVNDLDVIKNLVQIIEHSQCYTMENRSSGGCYQIHIRKI